MCKTCEILTCATCGKDFEYENRRGPKPKYCCFECRRAPYERKKKAERRNVKRYCIVCTQEIPAGRGYKYCSDECAKEGALLLWGTRICKQCGKEYLSASCDAKYCSKECLYASMRAVPECTCKNCGKQFLPKKGNRTTFCSRECAFEWKRLVGYELICEKCGCSFRSAVVQGKFCSDCKTRGIEVILVSVCSICGKHTDRPGNYCSDECLKSSNSRKTYEHSKKQFEESVKPRKCKNCKKVFTPEYGSKLRTFCSDVCRKRYGKKHYKPSGAGLNSRARKYFRQHYGDILPIMYEPISAKKVLERDNWTCGICGQPIDKKAKCPHPQSKSIDHIVALAKGGSHTYDNVQAAHFECNWRKGDQDHEETSALEPVNEAVHCGV